MATKKVTAFPNPPASLLVPKPGAVFDAFLDAVKLQQQYQALLQEANRGLREASQAVLKENGWTGNVSFVPAFEGFLLQVGAGAAQATQVQGGARAGLATNSQVQG